MAEAMHAPYEKLSRDTITLHQAIHSLMEELEAVDWYRQRADNCADAQLKAILLHNMREEMEHAAMLLEWLRRNNGDFAGHLATYLYSAGDIAAKEQAADPDEPSAEAPAPPEPPPSLRRFTIGPMK